MLSLSFSIQDTYSKERQLLEMGGYSVFRGDNTYTEQTCYCHAHCTLKRTLKLYTMKTLTLFYGILIFMDIQCSELTCKSTTLTEHCFKDLTVFRVDNYPMLWTHKMINEFSVCQV